MLKSQDRDHDALLAALKSGNYYSTQGPEIHDIRFEADEVRVVPFMPRVDSLGTGTRSLM